MATEKNEKIFGLDTTLLYLCGVKFDVQQFKRRSLCPRKH
jgi:hypothetical protein